MKVSSLRKRISIAHTHRWDVVADPAVGLWRKRECPGGDYTCTGRAEMCECGAGHFVPADPNLKTVELDLSTERSYARNARAGA